MENNTTRSTKRKRNNNRPTKRMRTTRIQFNKNTRRRNITNNGIINSVGVTSVENKNTRGKAPLLPNNSIYRNREHAAYLSNQYRKQVEIRKHSFPYRRTLKRLSNHMFNPDSTNSKNNINQMIRGKTEAHKVFTNKFPNESIYFKHNYDDVNYNGPEQNKSRRNKLAHLFAVSDYRKNLHK